MTNKMPVLIITRGDLEKAGVLEPAHAVDVAENAIRAYAAGRVIYPDKVSQIFDETTQNRTNCLPATLPDEGVCGMKWVSVFPVNPAIGKQNVSAVLLLSSTHDGFPLSFIEGTALSNLRTAAISAVAVKYLAKANARSVGFIGAGEQAKSHLLAFCAVRPSIKEVRVSSRTEQSVDTFVAELSPLLPSVRFVPCGCDYESAIRGCDIAVTAVSCQAPLLHADWLGRGCLYCHVGGWEDEYETPLAADKIVCDNWNTVKHRTQTVSRLYKMGRLTDSDIYADLDELASGKKRGRESDDEIIYFNSVGLSFVDVAMALDAYKHCKAMGLGLSLDMQGDCAAAR